MGQSLLLKVQLASFLCAHCSSTVFQPRNNKKKSRSLSLAHFFFFNLWLFVGSKTQWSCSERREKTLICSERIVVFVFFLSSFYKGSVCLQKLAPKSLCLLHGGKTRCFWSKTQRDLRVGNGVIGENLICPLCSVSGRGSRPPAMGLPRSQLTRRGCCWKSRLCEAFEKLPKL